MKIEVRNIYKIFGPQSKKWLKPAQQGLSKKDLLAQAGHTLGLNNINLTIEQGQIFVIMGLSGSGKSTLIRHLNRLIEPTCGQVLIDNQDIVNLSARQLREFRRHHISMVFQHFGLLPHKTVAENIAYGLKVQGVDANQIKKTTNQWIERVGLEGFDQQYPDHLSGGMQQRVGLARALATDPDILLMDEAFSALDPLMRKDMQDQLIELQRQLNKTIVFITHDLDEALRVGNRIAILNDGELVQEGSPEDILLNPTDSFVEAFLQDVNRGKILTTGHAIGHTGVTFTLRTHPQKALDALHKHGHDYACVLEGKVIKGVITKADVDRAIIASAKEIDGYVQEAVSVPDNVELLEALPKLLKYQQPVAVIGAEGEFRGWLSKSKVIDLVA